MSYDRGFYDTIRAGTRSSAAVVAPIVYDIVHPGSVIDVGCGEGWWASAFAECGASRVLGVDGGYVADRRVDFTPADLNDPLPELGRFDLAVSLEVAEHLSPSRAAGFVADLCDLAPVVLFSAAVPGQGGTGHINEQWPGYWADLFAGNGYRVSGAIRWRIWNDDRVENWYRQNLLFAAADGFDDLFESPLSEPWPVVHPVLFDHVRRR